MMELQPCSWEKSSDALSLFENTLRCSFCEGLLQDPCNLGNCDHLFCRVCVKEFVNSECCPSCQAPAWARDVQVNRELASVVQLFRKLRKIIASRPDIAAHDHDVDDEESLIPEIDVSDEDGDSPTPKEPEGNNMDMAMGEKLKKDCGGRKRKALHDQNHLEDPPRSRRAKVHAVKEPPSSGKRPDLIAEGEENDPYAMYDDVVSPRQEKRARETKQKGKGNRGGGSGNDSGVLRRKTVRSRRTKKALRQKLEKANNLWNKMAKNGTEAAHGSRKVNFSDYGSDEELAVVGDSQLDKSVPESQSQDSGLGQTKCQRSVGEGHGSTKNNSDQGPREELETGGDEREDEIMAISSITAKPLPVKGIIKKNIKGESPLHIACIKGDLEQVYELLQNGSDPNIKDHAGWTPLHEACNHGFVDIVAALLDHGALINIPGFENDSPLHDAISNNRPAVVKLLLERGASLDVRNIHGQRPRDLPASKVVIKALRTKQGVVSDLNSSFSSIQSMPASQQKKIVLLGTGLNDKQKTHLQSCARLLKGRVSSEFSQDITHLVTNVVTDGRCSRTMKFLQAVLLGKWVVNVSWVDDCLQTKSHVLEVNHEICGTAIDSDSEGARKSREMANSQFPPLFDGCHFFFHGTFSPPTPPKEELASLLKLGGASILARCPKPDDDIIQASTIVPYHAKPESELASCSFFIAYDHLSKRKPPSRIRTAKLCTVPVSWVMNCVSHYELQDLPE